MNRKSRTRKIVTCTVRAAVLLAAVPTTAPGRTCPDGEHPQIDVKAISIKYETSGFEATISGLSVFGAKFSASPRTLQKAAVATQKMNEFIKALVAGYNSCAISRIQYQEALEQLLPSLQDDAAVLEQFRQQMIQERQVDREHLNEALARYEEQLERFVELSGRKIDYERITAIVDERVSLEIESLQGEQEKINQDIFRRIAELERRSGVDLMATPEQVEDKFAGITAKLKSSAQHAENDYRKGYDLFQRYRFRESIPYFERAVDTFPLPEFYLILARAYEEAMEPEKAERTYREGIDKARDRKDGSTEARLVASLMFFSIRNSSDPSSFSNTFTMYQRLDPETIPDALEVALNQGDLKNAMMTAALMLITDGASKSYEVVLRERQELALDKGEDDPQVALYDSIRVVLLLSHKVQGLGNKAKTNDKNFERDQARAGELAQRVLDINRSAYGEMHMRVAISYSLLGSVMMEQGNYQAALKNFQKSLSINESIWGARHELVAGDHMNLALVYERMGDVDTALDHLMIARSWYAGLPAGKKGLEFQAVEFRIGKLESAKQAASKDQSLSTANGDDIKAVHVFHILLKSETEATSIITKLRSSANPEKDFRKLAEEYSTDSSSRNGGDLGWFRRKQMVEEFENAAFAMRPGEFSSKPVKTVFGWHVIYLKERK